MADVHFHSKWSSLFIDSVVDFAIVLYRYNVKDHYILYVREVVYIYDLIVVNFFDLYSNNLCVNVHHYFVNYDIFCVFQFKVQSLYANDIFFFNTVIVLVVEVYVAN